ncbi:hypothetical protein [Streptomyces sp. 8L]|uniref:hypothetical protein n=1 Tax=Streptomyces sp. 8L TaxID=2877242 RepID=UPI001CD722AF|nr:hypothetical protein [Streptomyces sp. 8L]MCA1223442.1 hypothetical protein [Streptomyces sp. 8L]
MRWLISAGLHPKASSTTLRVAEDLAKRMDYDTGHARYCLDETAARLGIDRSTVKRHVAVLRELGALAWVVHGTRRNVRSKLGLGGYAGTATIYAATIPAEYDDAMGIERIGAGYEARIVVDYRNPHTAPDEPLEGPAPVDNCPVDNCRSGSCAPPSLTSADVEEKVQMVGGFTTTAARSRKTPSTSPRTPKTSSSKKRATILGDKVTAAGMQLGDKLARAIRRRVPWMRNSTHDQIRWVCADMGEQQWTEEQAVRFVVDAGFRHAAGYAWEPTAPHRVVAAALYQAEADRATDRELRQDIEQAIVWEDSTAGRAAAERASLAALFAPLETTKPERTNEDRVLARLDWNSWPDVIDHYEHDKDDALDLYGLDFVTFAIRQDCRTRDRQEALYV